MAFLETPRFPTDISYGSRGGPGYNTEVIRVDSGHEKRLARWTYPLHEFDVVYGIKDEDEIYDLMEFFHAVSGRLHGFRFKDYADYKSTDDMSNAVSDTDQTLGTGDASTTTFQLIKTYTAGSLSKVRNITKPVSGTVVVSLDDVGQGSGWSVDTTTGIVTFTSAPGAGVVVKAGFEFDIPMRFDTDRLELSWEDIELLSTSVLVTEIRQ